MTATAEALPNAADACSRFVVAALPLISSLAGLEQCQTSHPACEEEVYALYKALACGFGNIGFLHLYNLRKMESFVHQYFSALYTFYIGHPSLKISLELTRAWGQIMQHNGLVMRLQGQRIAILKAFATKLKKEGSPDDRSNDVDSLARHFNLMDMDDNEQFMSLSGKLRARLTVCTRENGHSIPG